MLKPGGSGSAFGSVMYVPGVPSGPNPVTASKRGDSFSLHVDRIQWKSDTHRNSTDGLLPSASRGQSQKLWAKDLSFETFDPDNGIDHARERSLVAAFFAQGRLVQET